MKMKKYSRKRNAILEAIRSTKTHPTAEWVYNHLKPEYPDLSLGTVYRNISMFRDEGEIVSVGVVNGQEHFDGTVEPHTHFICEKCGGILDIDCGACDGLCESVSEQFGLKAIRHELTFRGYCGSCI